MKVDLNNVLALVSKFKHIIPLIDNEYKRLSDDSYDLKPKDLGYFNTLAHLLEIGSELYPDVPSSKNRGSE